MSKDVNVAVEQKKPSVGDFLKKWGLLIGFVVLAVFILLPTMNGLSVIGQRLLGILLFAVIVWMTGAMSYPASAITIIGLITLLLGVAPDPANSEAVYGTGKSVSLALAGYSNSAFGLVAAAMFISVAMTKTGLDRRIALVILSKVGTKVSRIYAGLIFVGLILALVIPSATARIAALIPIILGIIKVLGINKNSKIAILLIVGVVQADVFWNTMILTAAAQNSTALGFLKTELGVEIGWLDWLLRAAPFSLVGIVVYYFLSMKIHKPEFKELEGGDQVIRDMRAEIGRMTFDEKKLLVILGLLLFTWITGGILHNINTTASTFVAIAIFLLPKVGVMDWKYTTSKLNWGSIVMFGAGISLGSALLSTGAARWVGDLISKTFGLASAAPVIIIFVMMVLLVVIHLGFASATALASAMIPIVLAVLINRFGTDTEAAKSSIIGITIILQYTVSFGFILPVNSPQGMVTYGTEVYEVKDYMRSGIPTTIISMGLILLFSLTYWTWLGYI